MKITKKRIGLFIALILLVILAYGTFWFLSSYGPDAEAELSLKGSSSVEVMNTKDYIYFSPKIETSKGILFYPGAKVEPEAYSVLGLTLAENGIPFVVVKMPINFAIFDIKKAEKIKDDIPYDNTWYIGGHSLGGSMAAKYLYDHPESFSGIIFFASYPAGASNDLSNLPIKALSIRGSVDALVTREKVEAKAPYLPSNTEYVTIEGGNHSQFGSYGHQKGDNEALISKEEQMKQIIDAITKFMK